VSSPPAAVSLPALRGGIQRPAQKPSKVSHETAKAQNTSTKTLYLKRREKVNFHCKIVTVQLDTHAGCRLCCCW
jgi:hypothetical protein